MKRRAAPTASQLPSRPIEFLPRCFFLLVLRTTPRFDDASSSPPAPVILPHTPGRSAVEIERTLLEPQASERILDAQHTIRFCRFMNAMRRKHSAGQVLFITRSVIRGDEAVVVHLLVRWRLLCLGLSPSAALDPFRHHQRLLHQCEGGSVEVAQTLAGIAKGVDAELLFSRGVFENDSDSNQQATIEGSIQGPFHVFITKRFLICQSPADSSAVDGDERAAQPTVSELAALLKTLHTSMVVKLNASPPYDDQPIVRQGIGHLDLAGSTTAVDHAAIARFLESSENSTGVIAVHSSTGLGRAALCVACFLVKHAAFSANEAVGWLRFCLPGALPAWHVRTLQQLQASLQRDGDTFLSRRRPSVTGSTPRSGSRATTLDDLALSSLRLTSQISIGQIALGRDSLLGTREKTAVVAREKEKDKSTASSSHKELLATDTTLARRRPLTQGTATGRRRLDLYHQVHHRGSGADFTAIHKFLHPSTATPPPLRPTATAPDLSRGRPSTDGGLG